MTSTVLTVWISDEAPYLVGPSAVFKLCVKVLKRSSKVTSIGQRVKFQWRISHKVSS